MAAIRTGSSRVFQAVCPRSTKVVIPCTQRLKSMLATAAATEISNDSNTYTGLNPPPQCPMHKSNLLKTSSATAVSPSLLNSSAAVAAGAFTAQFNQTGKPFEEIPGPKGLPLLGTLLDYTSVGRFKTLEKMHEATVDRFREYGPIFKENIAGITSVHIIEPSDVQELFRTDGKTPGRILMEPQYHYRIRRKRNVGLANLQGEDWHKIRSPLQQLLIKPRSALRYLPKMEKCAEDFVDLMSVTKSGNGEVPEFQQTMYRWAIESMCYIFFEERLGCLNEDLSKDSEPVRMIKSVDQFFTGLRDLTFKFPFYKMGVQTRTWTEFAEAQDYFYAQSTKYVDRTLNNMKETAAKSDGSGEHEATFLEHIMAMYNYNVEDVNNVVNDLLLGSIDNLSHACIFILYCLAKNPEAQEQLHKEITSLLPEGAPLTSDTLQRAPFMKACVKETLRMFPVVDGTSRIPRTDITLGGYTIPAGTVVRVHCVAGMMEEYFKEAHIFKPERWLRDNEASHHVNPYLHLPFGKGPRMCIGRRLAEQDIYAMLFKLIPKYKVEWHHGDMQLLFRLTNCPDRPAQFTFVERK
ncbi:cytochrome P450 10-like [Amphiura filiformis]|uniref:cytochrome P450 10-like n=1 Tax=Amphiura filiformis TaxID=82378 RepID=UPI003B217399